MIGSGAKPADALWRSILTASLGVTLLLSQPSSPRSESPPSDQLEWSVWRSQLECPGELAATCRRKEDSK